MEFIELDKFLGPAGGEMALAFAAGCAAGYAFCMRTLYKVLKEQKVKDDLDHIKEADTLKAKIERQEHRIELLEERHYHGMERQHAQIRDSSYSILGRDKLVRGEEEDK